MACTTLCFKTSVCSGITRGGGGGGETYNILYECVIKQCNKIVLLMPSMSNAVHVVPYMSDTSKMSSGNRFAGTRAC